MFEIWKIGAAYINNLNKIMQQDNEAPRKANERSHFVQGKKFREPLSIFTKYKTTVTPKINILII